MRKRFSVFLVVMLLFASYLSPVSANALQQEKHHYIALGDSLAAGITPYRELGNGYGDMIAKAFDEQGVLGSFSKEFAVPGYTSSQVLADLEKSDQQQKLKNATIVTVSAGANDLLKLVTVDTETGKISIDKDQAVSTFMLVGENISKITKRISEISPEAEVFVMGYYFPYPHLSEAVKSELIMVAKLLNTTIVNAALAGGAHFVPVYDKFGENGVHLVPNSADVHPSVEGYQFMADAFFEVYSNITEAAIHYNDVPETYWAYKEIMCLAELGALQPRVEGQFQPEKPITKAEAAYALSRIMQLTTSMPENSEFKDVPESHPYYYSIAKLTEVGIFNKAENFNPEKPLTRAQMAKIITLAFDLKANGTVHFTDIPSKFWAEEYIKSMASHRIMNGYADGSFHPNQPTKRSQFAAILARTLTTMEVTQ